MKTQSRQRVLAHFSVSQTIARCTARPHEGVERRPARIHSQIYHKGDYGWQNPTKKYDTTNRPNFTPLDSRPLIIAEPSTGLGSIIGYTLYMRGADGKYFDLNLPRA